MASASAIPTLRILRELREHDLSPSLDDRIDTELERTAARHDAVAGLPLDELRAVVAETVRAELDRARRQWTRNSNLQALAFCALGVAASILGADLFGR